MSRQRLRRIRISRYRKFVCAITGIAFALLVSIEASHLHIGIEPDACPLYTAFAGKVEGPSAEVTLSQPVLVAYYQPVECGAPDVAHCVVVVLPPSRGPPQVA
jgi:hypothetical protein